jgi:hypothetical protein
MKTAPIPPVIDFDVEVEQGTTRRVLPLKAASKTKVINRANRILEIQGVRPYRVISAKERKR